MADVSPSRKLKRLSTDAARSHASSFVLKSKEGELLPLSTELNKLNLGVGITLYLQENKYFACIFLIMFCITLPTIFINRFGYNANPPFPNNSTGFSRLSIANSLPQNNCARLNQISLVTHTIPHFLLNAISMIFFICSFFWLTYKHLKSRSYLDPTIRDYTILVENLPKNITETDFKNIFQAFGVIVKIEIITKILQKLYLISEKNKKEIKIERFAFKDESVCCCCGSMKENETKSLNEIQTKIKSMESKIHPPTKAFITFNESNAVEKAIALSWKNTNK